VSSGLARAAVAVAVKTASVLLAKREKERCAGPKTKLARAGLTV
jgi:hypothetical protein